MDCLAASGQHQPFPTQRLLSRILGTACFGGLVWRTSRPITGILLGIAFVSYQVWDIACACYSRESLLLEQLSTALRVSCFAEGSDDPTTSEAVRRFEGVKKQTHCLFAAAAIVWGNNWVDDPLGGDFLEFNIARCLPRLFRFCLESRANAALDAFVFEVRGEMYVKDIPTFARTVHRVLSAISAADPSGADCVRRRIDRRGWYFEFASESFFVTTFSPCYGPTHPRYQFGVHPDSCFVLFQPEISFLRHSLPPDKPRHETNWERPVDVRDRIRVNFQRHGRGYRIPETVSYPPAHFIVAPEDALQDPPVEFWREPITA